MTLQFAVGGAVLPFMSMWLEEKGVEFFRDQSDFFGRLDHLSRFPFLWGMIADRYLPIEWMFFFLNGMAGVSMWWMQSQTEYGGLMLSFVFSIRFITRRSLSSTR